MRLLSGVLLALVLAACGTLPMDSSSTSPATAKKNPPPPVKSADAMVADRLINSWRTQGLKAEAAYNQIEGTPADRIEWKSLSVNLPALESADSESVLRSVGQFAAQAKQPVRIKLYTKSRKQDTSLTQALKKGAIESGGRNSVKLDHYIGSNYQPSVQISVREAGQ